jgi:hypothetical protein
MPRRPAQLGLAPETRSQNPLATRHCEPYHTHCGYAERIRNFKNGLLMAVHLMGVNGALGPLNRGKIRALIHHNVVPDTTAFPYARAPAEFERQIFLITKKYNAFISTRAERSPGLRPTELTCRSHSTTVSSIITNVSFRFSSGTRLERPDF